MNNCPRCGCPISPGDAVDYQDGPHVYCPVPAIAVLPPESFERQGTTYTISKDGQSITCLICGMTSYNPNDVRERYCGNCHGFHDVKKGSCVALDEHGNEVAWVVEGNVEFVISKIRGM
jgi:hypothetical protein